MRSTSTSKTNTSGALCVIASRRAPALAALVETRLRDAIMFGELGLGEAISEDRLATMLGVSRTPVREALTALQMQGLVAIQPQRGSYVFQPTKADIEELCEFRAMLETGALKLAFNNDQGGTLRALLAAQEALADAEASDDWVAAARADADFHGAMFQHCGNHVFVQAYDLISGRIGAARFFTRQSKVSKRRTGVEHRAIIKAFARGDVDGAITALTEHIAAMPNRFAEVQQVAATALAIDA